MHIENWLLALFFIIINVFLANASHFDGGSISYKVIGTNGSDVIVRITQSYTYVYPTIYCNETYIANQLPLDISGYPDASVMLNCINATSVCTATGYKAVPVVSKCTDFSKSMAISVGQRTDDVAVKNGSDFVVAFKSAGFRTLNLPSVSNGLSWSLASRINLVMKSDGTYNTPPKATMISPVYIPVGVPQTISIPTIDEDNDNVRCRFASGTNECGGVCPPASLPTGTTISSNCTLSITGAKAGDWYAVAIQAEDYATPTSTTPYSSVPVQFLVYVYDTPACTPRPYLYGPGNDGTCIAVQVGVPYTLILYAENNCTGSGVKILDIATQSFPIVKKEPIVQNSTTLSSVTLVWTPTATEVGSQVFCSVAIDSQSVQSNQYCLTFDVGEGTMGQCPGEEPTTEPPTTTTTTTSTTSTTTTTTTTTTTETTTTVTTTTTTATTDITPVVVSTILIPVWCCCCCWIYYFTRPCTTIDDEERKREVTTYTIRGANEHIDHSILDRDNIGSHQNEVDPNNSFPSYDPSFVTLLQEVPNTDPTNSKLFSLSNYDPNRSLPLNNDPNRFLSSYNDPNGSLPSYTASYPTRTNGIGTQPLNYDLQYPASSIPRYLVTNDTNTSSAPATIRNLAYSENTQRTAIPLYMKKAERPNSASSLKINLKNDQPKETHTRSTVRPWTKHPRWVVRLSEPKRTYTAVSSSRQVANQERPVNSVNSSIRSTSTLPRYAFNEE